MPRIEFRCNDAEKRRWESRADDAGIGLSELCRALLNGTPLPRASRAADNYRRLCELVVLAIHRLEEVRADLRNGKAPQEVILLFLAYECDIRSVLEEIAESARSAAPSVGEHEEGEDRGLQT